MIQRVRISAVLKKDMGKGGFAGKGRYRHIGFG
jgi:hypothetical protein